MPLLLFSGIKETFEDQIRNANDIVIDTDFTREQWMPQFYNQVHVYYDKVVQKAQERQSIMQLRADEWNK